MPLTLVAIVVAVVAWVWLRNLKLALLAGIGIVVLLAVTGRLHFVFAGLAFLYPLLRRLLPSLLRGGLGRVAGGAGPKSGNQSHVSSDILEMTLDVM